MAPVMCPLDIGHEDVEVLKVLPDGCRRARCPDCDYVWVHGEARPTSAPRTVQPPLRPMPIADTVSPRRWPAPSASSQCP